MALRVEIARNYLLLIELGRSSPSVRMLLHLCSAQNADVLGDVERVEAQKPFKA